LRLILSSHEAGYIDSGLHEARIGLRQIFQVGAIAIIAAVILIVLIVYGNFPTAIDAFLAIVLVFAAVTILVCAVNGLGAYISLKRFRSYHDDHDKFLKHYRRNA
jgi:hypothetical protein